MEEKNYYSLPVSANCNSTSSTLEFFPNITPYQKPPGTKGLRSTTFPLNLLNLKECYVELILVSLGVTKQ